MQKNDMPRWKNLRIRAFSNGVAVTELAQRLDYSRPYLSDVLNGKIESTPALDKVEAELDRLESIEHAQAA